jgi:hypothetical protein
MFGRVLSSGLIVLLIQLACVYPVLANNSKKEAEQTEKVKAGIARLGVGAQAGVKLKP